MKKEKNPQNKKKTLMIVAIAVVAVVFLLASPFIFYSGPTSMMPAKWTDAILAQSNKVDFAAYKTVTVAGHIDGKQISATYDVSIADDRGVFTCKESSGDEAALQKLEKEIIPKALLTFSCSTDLADAISAGQYDAICMLQKYTVEMWWGDEEQGDATSELYTWGEDLALKSYTVTTRPDGTAISELTFQWN